ncbi:MAG: hypothetical protein OXC80_05610 [Gammaproteobacteria bacterium]|nr:hypothetical protein [Gammaproteobacteria bacterium]
MHHYLNGFQNQRLAFLVSFSLISLSVSLAQFGYGQWYFEMALGANKSNDVTVESHSNDRASICDEFINPRALSIESCTTSLRGVGDGWMAPFEPGSGFSGEVTVGFHISEYRLAASYSHNVTDFEQTVSSTDATGADFDKLSNELAIGEETLGFIVNEEFTILGYRDWYNGSGWTPFVGVGLGITRMRMDFSWVWARNSDPEAITTGEGQPNVDEIRSNLAGTVSAGRRTLRGDPMIGYTVLAGIEREISEMVSIGLKVQWKQFDTFKSDWYTGDVLRSHEGNLRLDGSEPVSTWSNTPDTGRLSSAITMRVTFM